MTSKQRNKFDRKVYALRNTGFYTWTELAAIFGKSVSGVRLSYMRKEKKEKEA